MYLVEWNDNLRGRGERDWVIVEEILSVQQWIWLNRMMIAISLWAWHTAKAAVVEHPIHVANCICHECTFSPCWGVNTQTALCCHVDVSCTNFFDFVLCFSLLISNFVPAWLPTFHKQRWQVQILFKNQAVLVLWSDYDQNINDFPDGPLVFRQEQE